MVGYVEGAPAVARLLRCVAFHSSQSKKKRRVDLPGLDGGGA